MKMKVWQSKTYGTRKAVLRGKFIALQFYLRKKEKPKIKNLTLHLKQLEGEEQTKTKVRRRKKIIKIREEINEIEREKQRKDKWNEKMIIWKDKEN